MDERELLRAMEEAMRLPKTALQEMGRRGRSLVAEKYSWASVGEQLTSAYKWLLGQSAKPDCVHTTAG